MPSLDIRLLLLFKTIIMSLSLLVICSFVSV